MTVLALSTNRQWVPPPPDPADEPVGEAGYSLQIYLQARLSKY